MVSRPVSLNSIDETFTKILIEELAGHDQVTDLGGEASSDAPSNETQWETIANVQVPAEPNAAKMETAPVQPSDYFPEQSAPEWPPASNEPRHWQLRIIYKDGRECTLPLEDKPITIGRSRDNALAVKCDRVSRHHARIQLDSRGPRVDDLDSRNGILVNGIKVPAAYLKPEDVLKIGSVEIHLNLA